MYDIFADTQVVGQAEVIKEGLYYRFTCKCTLPDGEIYRIVVNDGNNARDLGICVPTGERFGLVCRVPVKYLPGSDLRFALMPKYSYATVASVATNEPFAALDRLDSAHLQVTEGKVEIVTGPVQDLQDNDLSQGYLHKWEQT